MTRLAGTHLLYPLVQTYPLPIARFVRKFLSGLGFSPHHQNAMIILLIYMSSNAIHCCYKKRYLIGKNVSR